MAYYNRSEPDKSLDGVRKILQIPFGQYSLELESDLPVCASFGRLDRRYNLGYYVSGYCAS